jgi:hypothetical protein
MLKDYKVRHIDKKRYVEKKGHIVEETLPKPDSRLLEVKRNEWHCPPCGGSMPHPHTADTMQEHLAARAHKTAMSELWLAFVKHMRAAFGLRDDQIPDFLKDLDDTIPQKPRDSGDD